MKINLTKNPSVSFFVFFFLTFSFTAPSNVFFAAGKTFLPKNLENGYIFLLYGISALIMVFVYPQFLIPLLTPSHRLYIPTAIAILKLLLAVPAVYSESTALYLLLLFLLFLLRQTLIQAAYSVALRQEVFCESAVPGIASGESLGGLFTSLLYILFTGAFEEPAHKKLTVVLLLFGNAFVALLSVFVLRHGLAGAAEEERLKENSDESADRRVSVGNRGGFSATELLLFGRALFVFFMKYCIIADFFYLTKLDARHSMSSTKKNSFAFLFEMVGSLLGKTFGLHLCPYGNTLFSEVVLLAVFATFCFLVFGGVSAALSSLFALAFLTGLTSGVFYLVSISNIGKRVDQNCKEKQVQRFMCFADIGVVLGATVSILVNKSLGDHF